MKMKWWECVVVKMHWRNCFHHLIGPSLCETNPLYQEFTAQSVCMGPSILSPLWWVWRGGGGVRELIKPYEHQHEQPASWPDSSLLRKPPHVSNHRGPSWTVPLSQCTDQNTKPWQKTARSGREVTSGKPTRNSVTRRILPRETTSLSSSIRCHD